MRRAWTHNIEYHRVVLSAVPPFCSALDVGCGMGMLTRQLACVGLPVLQETAAINLLAVRAGAARLSIFGDRTDKGETGWTQFTLGTQDIDATITELKARGIVVHVQPIEAPGFMRFVIVRDPEGNTVGIAQHLRDPLAPI